VTAKRKKRSLSGKLDIRSVAERAKVSIATVSRTINGISTVGPDLAKRVWKAIEELDYYPNTQARGLVSGRSRLLGLVISEITNPFFPELIQGFEEIAVENGYEILIGSTNYDPKQMSLVIRRMLERKVEGVAVMTFGIEEPLLQQLAERNVPLTLIDFALPNPLVSTLRVDYGASSWCAGPPTHHVYQRPASTPFGEGACGGFSNCGQRGTVLAEGRQGGRGRPYS